MKTNQPAPEEQCTCMNGEVDALCLLHGAPYCRDNQPAPSEPCHKCGRPTYPIFFLCEYCDKEGNQTALSDTPRTDEQACPFNDLPSEESDDEVVPADFARELERTIARLSAEREKERTAFAHDCTDLSLKLSEALHTLAERDKQLAEALAEIVRLKGVPHA